MVKQTIQVFCRLKPTKQALGVFEVNKDDTDQDLLAFTQPKNQADGYINNKKENYKFSFTRIFEQVAKQDEVFTNVAQPVISNVLSGFNGTIFAYGQTGSGKTFSITGGAERYVDRGIIPRSLSYIFEELMKNADHIFTVHISYLEIYNECGYDLLDPKHETSKLEDLPKISLLEDSDGNIHLKNLSIHQAANEEEALNLLFLGDTNRMIAETPMNEASTRSHCIFTIHIMVREADSATIHRSKLHLVDLAGSERVSKTGAGGVLLREARYINLSLHCLEQVIIALSEKNRTHIPYRNSMMTSVLRDSLGGNCMTSMIATCSVEKRNIDESISTCRFAQRVAMIKNDAILNEELDPKLMIAKLKREIQQLKDELSLAKGEEYDSELDDEERERLRALVASYIDDKDDEAVLAIGADMKKINFCFTVFKKHVLNNKIHRSPDKLSGESDGSSVKTANPTTQQTEIVPDTSYLSNKEVSKLKELIVQRDNEINILVNMLKKEKLRADKVSELQKQNFPHTFDSISNEKRSPISTPPKVLSERNIDSSQKLNGNSSENIINPPRNDNKIKDNLQKMYQRTDSSNMSIGRKEAFDIFRRDYKDNEIIEENKRGLKARYADAKQLGEEVNNSRLAINNVKSKLEKLKSVHYLQAADGSSTAEERLQEEKALRDSLDLEKTRYKEAFNRLKLLKTEIEHIQHLLERLKMKMQKDFEIWWIEEASRTSNRIRSNSDVKTAWKTPPPLTPKSSNANDLTPVTPKSEEEKSSLSESSKSQKSILSMMNGVSKNSMTSGKKDRDLVSGSLSRPSSGIRLTGDQKTDEDILAFMKAREELMQKTKR